MVNFGEVNLNEVDMVDLRGIEPRLSDCKTDVLPLSLEAHVGERLMSGRHGPIWWGRRESNPRSRMATDLQSAATNQQ